MKWFKLSLSLLVLMLPNAYALRTVAVVNHAHVKAVIAANAYNVLRVNGDRIQHVTSTSGQYTLYADQAQGILYLKPAMSSQQIHAIVTTEHGLSFQVTLRVRNREAQTVLFIPPDSFKPRAKQWEQHTAYPSLLVTLTKAMVQGDTLEGYSRQGLQASGKPIGRIATLTPIERYQGAQVVGTVYRLHNKTQHRLQLTAAQLYRPGVRSLTLSSQVVPVKGDVFLYEVSSDE